MLGGGDARGGGGGGVIVIEGSSRCVTVLGAGRWVGRDLVALPAAPLADRLPSPGVPEPVVLPHFVFAPSSLVGRL